MDRRKHGFTWGYAGTCWPGWTPAIHSSSLPSRIPQHLLQFSYHTVPGLITLCQTSPSVGVEFKNPCSGHLWQKQHDKGLFFRLWEDKSFYGLITTSWWCGRGSSNSKLVSSSPPSTKWSRGSLHLSLQTPVYCGIVVFESSDFLQNNYQLIIPTIRKL